MGTEQKRRDLEEINGILQEAKDSINDFTADDVDVGRVPVVERDLENIWELAKKFSNVIRVFKVK